MKTKGKNIIKRFCAISLASCMLTCYASHGVGAVASCDDNGVGTSATEVKSETPAEDFCYYENYEGTITITEYYKNDADVVIPSEIDGKPVTVISTYAFYEHDGVKNVTFPDTLKIIDMYAFENCTELTSLTLPDSVVSIGMYAFHNTGIMDVTFGNSITDIGTGAFSGCQELTSVTIPDSVPFVSMNLFENCYKLKDVKIGNGVKFIGGGAFENCMALSSITIPDSAIRVDDYSFRGCKNLTDVTIPRGITYIGGSAFEDCTSLTSITIPDSVTEIGNYAFGYCFDDSVIEYFKIDDFTIYGYSGTEAEAYAIKNDIPFVVIEDTDPNKGLLGDVNLDGNIDVTDATYIQMSVADLTELSDEAKANADVNRDGIIDVTDATLVQMFAANAIDSFE